MKHLRLLTLCLIVFSLASLISCSRGGEPQAPCDVFVEYQTLTLKWDASPGARLYTVCIEGEGTEPQEVEISKNFYSLESLSAGNYTLSVYAKGRDGEISPISERVPFIRDEECGLIFTLLDNGEYEVSGKTDATGVITVPETYRQRPVTSVGERAFFGAADVSRVVLPESIRSIGAFAFASCSYLESVNMPESLTSLGESAFSGCRKLGGTLTLPDGLTDIPSGAFAYCSSLVGVELGSSVVSIGDNAFTDATDIKSLAFPPSLKTVGAFAFAACADVGEISFSEGLLHIGEFAFSKALSLTSLTLPNSLLTIGKGAFYHSTSLSSVSLGEGLCEIGDSAFLETNIYNSSQTNEIYIGDWFIGLKDTTAAFVNIRAGTVGVANSALYANQYVSAIELPDSVKYVGKNAFAVSNLVSIVLGGGVVSIGDQAFLYCESLIDVLLGSYDYTEQALKASSLEKIGNYAFMNCTRLARIEIPASVKDIGSYAFRNTEMYNSSLTGAVYAGNWIVDFNDTVTDSITVDRGTVGIARYAFYGCDALKSIRIDGSVKYLCRGAFYSCTALESVTFPDTLECIDDYAFYGCSSLKLTRLPPMLKKIGRSAFYMCGTADNYISDSDSDILEIPSGVTYIGDFAFFACGYRRADAINGNTETAGIDIITMGDGIEYIGKSAFRGFASLRGITVAGAAVIGDRAFCECPSLEYVEVGSALTSIGERAFYRCTSLARVSLPDSLRHVGNYAFYRCESLCEVSLGGGLESIGDLAFFGNVRLESVTLPQSLTSIGEQAFRDASSLTVLNLGANITYIGAHAFYGCSSLTLYVESGAERAGWSAGWNSDFVPTVLGCEIAQGSVVSVLCGSGTVLYDFSDTTVGAPRKEGFVFLGWSADASATVAEYTSEQLSDIAAGERLYAVYKPIGDTK